MLKLLSSNDLSAMSKEDQHQAMSVLQHCPRDQRLVTGLVIDEMILDSPLQNKKT